MAKAGFKAEAKEVKMLEDRFVYMNGEYVPWDQATVHMMSHSFSRGSGIFEVLSVHDTSAGPMIFRLDEHIERLHRSAELLDMDLPLSTEGFFEAVHAAVKRNGVREGAIKIMGYYPQVAFEILPLQKTLDVAIFVIDPAEDLGGLKVSTREGTSLCISRWRKLDPQTVPIEAKAAANYLNGMMARKDAQSRGFGMAVMLDTQGFVAEGGTESVFLVKDGRLMTPSEGTVLKSITRMSVIQAAKVTGMDISEGRLSPDLLLEADEIFLSATPMKIMPVKQIEDRIPARVPGPTTQTLSKLMSEIVAGRDERFKTWLFPLE